MSQPFYLIPGGYKLCILVDANGFGDGGHAFVFVYLMKGENDYITCLLNMMYGILNWKEDR